MTRRINRPINFNPRTREGCDIASSSLPVFRVNFNPRTREGCDSIMRSSGIESPISIHAPARGATYDYFSIWHCVTFQSTHPRGCDQGKSAFSRLPSYFNPRTREGCDDRLDV
nr:MAG TPA: hypothetical protein [Caudoviricetes sp.]